MKETTKGSRALGYLEKMYRQLNIDKFNGDLPDCLITVQSTPGAYGHVTLGKVWRVKDTERYELNISADTIDRPIESVVSTLLHEMVHIFCMENGIKDTSRNGTYHNRRFKEQAELRGLVIGYDKRIGHSPTSPSEDLINYIIENDWSDILIGRHSLSFCPGGGSSTSPGAYGGSSTSPGADFDQPQKIKKPSSTRKYVCPCCGMSVRATRQVNIICGDCTEQMEVVD